MCLRITGKKRARTRLRFLTDAANRLAAVPITTRASAPRGSSIDWSARFYKGYNAISAFIEFSETSRHALDYLGDAQQGHLRTDRSVANYFFAFGVAFAAGFFSAADAGFNIFSKLSSTAF